MAAKITRAYKGSFFVKGDSMDEARMKYNSALITANQFSGIITNAGEAKNCFYFEVLFESEELLNAWERVNGV